MEPWAALALACLALRVVGVIAVGARGVPAWSGPLVEVLLWIGGPAIVDPAALSNVTFWLALVLLLLLWSPAVALARQPRGPRPTHAALIATAVVALSAQAVTTQGLVAGTVNEATAGRICQFPRKIVGFAGDLFPAPPGTTRTLCVQGRPGGGYIGDWPGP